MDKTSKKILNHMKASPDNILMYYDEPYKKLDISEEEFYRCVRYLVSEELIEYAENQDGIHLGIMLSHKAVHSKEFKREAILNVLKERILYTYILGVATGVTVTILSQFLLAHGVQLISKLFELIGIH